MAIIKNVKRYFYSKDNISGGEYEFAHQCKVNLDSNTGAYSFIIPNHIYDVFDRHDINSNEDFKNQMTLKMNKKKEPLVEFEAITMFEPCIDIINRIYANLRKNEITKKVIVMDAHLALFFRNLEGERYGFECNENIQDMMFNPFKTNSSVMNHAIHFGYKVGYQIGTKVYSQIKYENVSPSPYITSIKPHRKEDETQVVIDWTQERQNFLEVIADSMKKLILQIRNFRENLSDPKILERIDKKQISAKQLMIGQNN